MRADVAAQRRGIFAGMGDQRRVADQLEVPAGAGPRHDRGLRDSRVVEHYLFHLMRLYQEAPDFHLIIDAAEEM